MKNKLFENVENIDEVKAQFIRETIKKDTYIVFQGEKVNHLYILLKGRIEVSKYDIDGSKSIVTILEPEEMFAESVAISEKAISPFNVRTLENCEVIKIEPKQLLILCPQIIYNMMRIMSDKNVFFSKKISCISQNTIRKRINEYFRIVAIEQQSRKVHTPFNKTQFAQYLCVDRSSLSRELHKMEEEKLLKDYGEYYELSSIYFNE